MRFLLCFLLAGLLTGCSALKAPVKAYHFMYCDQMNPDGLHCDRWATPCGTLDCHQ